MRVVWVVACLRVLWVQCIHVGRLGRRIWLLEVGKLHQRKESEALGDALQLTFRRFSRRMMHDNVQTIIHLNLNPITYPREEVGPQLDSHDLLCVEASPLIRHLKCPPLPLKNHPVFKTVFFFQKDFQKNPFLIKNTK